MENLDLELSFSNEFSSWCPTDVIGWTETDLAELKQSFDQRIPHQYESPSSWPVSDDESRYSGGLDALPEAYLNDAKATVFEFGTYAPNRDGAVMHDDNDAKDRMDYTSIRTLGHDHSGTTSAPHSSCPSPSEAASPAPASSTARRRRTRIINAQQRLAANVRERKRMTCMNAAFDSLRQRMPASNYDRRRSRIDILKSAVSYIQFLTGILKTV